MNTTFKNIFTTLLLIVFAFTINAQDKNFHFGLKGNGGFYWLKSNDDTTKGNGSKFGAGYGLMLEFGFTPNYYLLTGLEVQDMGARSKADIKTSVYTSLTTSSSSVRYLEVPLLLKMKTKEIGMMKYFGQFGLKTGFALSAKNSSTNVTTFGNVATTTSSSDTKKDDIFPLREALLIGLGAEYNLSGNTSIVFSACYDNGFTPLLNKKNHAVSSITNPKLFSKGIVISLGVIF